MTQDQIILLLDLKASQERGAASMSCNQRITIASELNQRGLVDQIPYGPSFYRINERGLKALKKNCVLGAQEPIDLVVQLDKLSEQQTLLLKVRNEILELRYASILSLRQLTGD